MVDSGESSGAGFWTLTRPSKLSKRRNSDLHELHHKVFNISVVGLSGVEKDKGPIGIGKSCLCNRFIRSAADDYHPDHISVLSQSDFGGRVVNNDHWLYWGSVIKSCEGYDLAFNVVEQTEFVDDACFQPFKSGKTDPYYKRCANTKLVSPEKLMYICKNQLGVEREYEQRYLPDGKFNVDGFLCLFDVSQVQGRDIDKQIELTNLILINLIKTKKPVVFVATKYDEANEILVAEAERLVNQRDFRGLVPIVETSAQENVNINMAFLVCAQLIDKTRAKLRVTPFHEAHKSHLHLLRAAAEDYKALIRSTVIDHNCTWQQVCIKLSHNPEFLRYTYLHGLDKASIVFKNHIQKLRSTCINAKILGYLEIFPDILNELVPPSSLTHQSQSHNNNELTETQTASQQSWENVKEQIRSHPSFGKYFITVPPTMNWFDTELLQSSDNRIPFDWLNSKEAFDVYQQREFLIEAEQKRQRTKEMFAQMLANTKISVGKPFVELKHLLASNPDLDILSEQELFKIYVEYQNNLLQQARSQFQELLLENAEHLHHLTSSNKVIRQQDIKTINAILQHDERYQALDRFDQDRTLMMIRHLSFLHSQSSEQCPSYPKCVEPEVERLLITKAKSIVNRFYETKARSQSMNSGEGSHLLRTCDLMIIGPRRPSQQLVLALNVLNSRTPKASQFQITFTVFENADDINNEHQRFRQADSRPKGCFGIFTNRRSLENVRFTLQKFMQLTSQIKNDKNHFSAPPIVMLYAADITLDENTMLSLENEGQLVADQFKCPFMNVTAIDQYRKHQQNTILANDQDLNNQTMSECASLDYACVDAAFSVLKEAISRKVCFMELYNNQDLIPRQAFSPDARILVCLLCGEPHSTELLMWKSFLNLEDCYVTSSKSICLRTKSERGEDRYIELIITSYTHGAFNYRDDLLHGFTLVCSLERKASISILNAFSFNIPCTPVLVLAIKSESNASDKLTPGDEYNKAGLLIDEAEAAARRLKGHFEILDLSNHSESTTTTTFNDQRMKSFLTNVLNWKPTIERAYDLGDREIQLPLEVSQLSQDNNRATVYHHSKVIPSPGDNQKSEHSSLVKGASSRYYAEDLSSDEELIDGANEKSFSDESEAYSSLSNSGLSKPIELAKEDQRTDSLKRLQSNKDSNDNLSDEDTDSTDNNKQDKPKPGKLDLSQYNNITNAIGKLNVQPTNNKQLTAEFSTLAQTKVQQTLPNSTQEKSGFFKSRTRKVKNHQEKIQKQDVETRDDKQKSDRSFHLNADRKLPKVASSFDKHETETSRALNSETSKSKSNPRKTKDIPSNLSTSNTSSKQKSSQNSKSPHTTQNPVSIISNDTGDCPRAAPRSAVASSSVASSVPISSSNISKRVGNNRGRAVAPPKLPGFSSSLDLDCSLSVEDSSKVRNMPTEVDQDIDYNQSPIAQRLIRCLKDHKVSELNSPPESDSDLPHPTIHSEHRFYSDHISGTENNSPSGLFQNSSIDSSELINSRGAAIRQLNEILANKQPPRRFGMLDATRTPSLEQDQPPLATQEQSAKKSDKDSKREKKKLRDDEKLEKRRIKEEERLRRQEKKQAGKKSKLTSPVVDKTVDDDGIPFFIKRCIEFIENEGLDAEGIYRVPGNRAHVDAFVQKLQDDPNMSILESDVPVNAVATSLKDFLSKKWSPIIPQALMNELTELSCILDREQRVAAIKDLIQRLPPANYRLLKYVFGHFVKVSLNHTLNSMDSKNLAICWWPTLLPLHFNDMTMFEQMRPHLEESIQTMIDQYDYIFDSESPKLVAE